MLRAIKKVFGKKKNKAKEEVERQRTHEEEEDDEYGDDMKWNYFEDDNDSQGKGGHQEELVDNLGLYDRDFLAGNHPNSVLTQEGVTIVLVKGSIADQTVDAIVNSVGSEFDLSQGALSRSILEAAGEEIQVELLSVKSPDVGYGQVTTTKGHYLSCSFVFHGVLEKWNDDDAKEILRFFINECLLEADKRRLRSIAIPAVGTGILGYPSDLVVNCLFNEADKFSASNPDTTVNEIRFVVYEKDQKTFKAFEDKMTKILPSGNEAGANNGGDEFINNFDDEDEVSEFRNDFEEHMRDLQQEAKSSAAIFNKAGSVFPSPWKQTPAGKEYGITELSSNESEFKMVTKRLMETKGTAPIRGIIKIERIENRTLYQLYTVYKSAMEQRNSSQVENERILWHGTAKQSLFNICSGGLNRGYCGKNAVVYGKGVYFARNFSYSAQPTYSPPDENGVRYVFLCRVLTGTFMVGRDTMVEPEMKAGTDFRYDSTVDSVSSPNIFVVFKDSQAYPEYLVSFH